MCLINNVYIYIQIFVFYKNWYDKFSVNNLSLINYATPDSEMKYAGVLIFDEQMLGT